MQAWADLYQFQAVVETDELSVFQCSRPARGCLSYLIISRGKAIVIDPLRHTDRYTDFAKKHNCHINLILDTHGHADHISGGAVLAEATGAPYYLHPYDAIHPIDVLAGKFAFEYLCDDQQFTVGLAKLRAIHIPGHTLGNMAFLLTDNYLFSGDSIFLSSIARPDLGGRAETWAPLHYHSLRRLMELPDSTLILPGHFSTHREANENGRYAASLGELKQKNEGLIMAQKDEQAFLDHIMNSLPRFMPQYIEIKRVNAGLTTIDSSDPAQLELGRNVCALAKSG
jgi:glyoxylase-like metal-dependent hydrolase (beta-lactamase superfamily II)